VLITFRISVRGPSPKHNYSRWTQPVWFSTIGDYATCGKSLGAAAHIAAAVAVLDRRAGTTGSDRLDRGFYNALRLHSSISYQSPAAFEKHLHGA